jgi:hypothetical protein
LGEKAVAQWKEGLLDEAQCVGGCVARRIVLTPPSRPPMVAHSVDAELAKWHAMQWVSAPDPALSVAINRLAVRLKDVLGSRFDESAHCCESSLPYVVARAMDFPPNVMFYLCFALRLRDSHYERVSFVLRVAEDRDKFDFGAAEDMLTAFYPGLTGPFGLPDLSQ